MPITLGDTTSSSTPEWNKSLLTVIWAFQLVFCLLTGWAFFVNLIFGGSFVLFLLLAGTAVAAVATGYEIRLAFTNELESRLFYRFELAKSVFCSWVLLVGLVNHVWSVVMFVIPFWGAFYYAVFARKQTEGAFWREIRELW